MAKVSVKGHKQSKRITIFHLADLQFAEADLGASALDAAGEL